MLQNTHIQLAKGVYVMIEFARGRDNPRGVS